MCITTCMQNCIDVLMASSFNWTCMHEMATVNYKTYELISTPPTNWRAGSAGLGHSAAGCGWSHIRHAWRYLHCCTKQQFSLNFLQASMALAGWGRASLWACIWYCHWGQNTAMSGHATLLWCSLRQCEHLCIMRA